MALKELQELRTPSGDPVKVASAERDGSGENIEENYAKQTGYYSQLGAGTADNLRATIGSTDEADIIFRPTGGSADVSDGNAEIISVRGNVVDKDGSYVFTHFKGIKTIGFNQWNGEYIHVLPSESFNNYVISGSFGQVIWYETLENLRSHTDGVTIEILEGQNTSGEHYDYFTIAEEGYIEVIGSAADTCVAFIWSGYRVLDFEEYWTDTLEVDSNEYFPQGMAKAGSVYDELTSSKAITRIGRNDFAQTDAVMVSEDEDIHYLVFDVAITLPGAKVSGAVASNVPNADVLEITEMGVRFRALAADYGTAEAFKQAILGKTVLYELAEPSVEEVTVNMIYPVSDFGTEELLFDVLPPSVEIIFYQMNLRDKLQRLPGVGELNAALDSKADKTVVEEEYAKQDGHYPKLISGLADNLNSKTGLSQTASFDFRTAGGSADITDGNAEITAIYGNTKKVDGEYVHSDIETFESIGFNQWNGEYVYVIPSAGFNGYCVSGTYLNVAYYPTLDDLRADTNRTDLAILNGVNTSGVHYQYFEIENRGYVRVFGAASDTCVSFVWSGYRVADFEKHWQYDLEIDSQKYFPDGMKSLEGFKDEINSSEAVQRVGQHVFTGDEEVTIYSEDGDEIIFEVPAEIVNYGTEVGTNIPYITNNLLFINGTGVLTPSAITSIINNTSPEKRAEITQVVVSTGFTEESAYKAIWATDFSALPLLDDNIFYGAKRIDFTTYTFQGSGVLTQELVSEQALAIPESRRQDVLRAVVPTYFTDYLAGALDEIFMQFVSLEEIESPWLNGMKTDGFALTILGSGQLTESIVESAVSSMQSNQNAFSMINKVVVPSTFTSVVGWCMNVCDNYFSDLSTTLVFEPDIAFHSFNYAAGPYRFQTRRSVNAFNKLVYKGTKDVWFQYGNPVCVSVLAHNSTGKITLDGSIREIDMTNATALAGNFASVGVLFYPTSVTDSGAYIYMPARTYYPSVTNFNAWAQISFGASYGFLGKRAQLTPPLAQSNYYAKKMYCRATDLVWYLTDANWRSGPQSGWTISNVFAGVLDGSGKYNNMDTGFIDDYSMNYPTLSATLTIDQNGHLIDNGTDLFTGYIAIWYSDEDCTTVISDPTMINPSDTAYVKLTAI